MRKIVSLFLSVVMLLSLIAMPAMAAEVTETVLIDMNFDKETTETNILSAVTDADVDVKGDKKVIKPSESAVSGVGAMLTTDTPYASASEYAASASISVVINQTIGDRTGNFLKINNNSGTETYGQRNQVVGTIAPNTTDSTALALKGSILVTEYDIYLDSTVKGGGNISAVMAPSTVDIETVSNYASAAPYIKYSKTGTTLTVNAAKAGLAEKAVTINGWTKVRIITDATGDSDIMRVYIGDTLVAIDDNYDYPTCSNWGTASVKTPFEGLTFGGYGAGTGSIYYDNIKVTKINKDFDVASYDAATFAAFEQGTTSAITFTTNVDSTTVDEIYLATEDGTKVDGAITAAVDSADASKVNITLGEGVAVGSYKLVMPATFIDVYGQGIGTYGAPNKELAVTVKASSKVKVTTLIDENFDGLDDFDVMDEFTTAASGYKYKNGIGAGLSYASASAETIDTIKAASSVEVVSTNIPGGRTGKVLKYFNYAGYTTYTKGRNHVIGQIQPISTLTANDLDLTNSILVTEYDMYIEAAGQPSESTIASPSAIALASNNVSHNSVIQADVNNSSFTVTEISNKASTSYTKGISGMNNWKKVRIVVDTADNSYRMYIDGALVQVANSGVVKSDIQVGCVRQALATFPTTFYGLSFGGYARDDADTNKGAVYYDNIKVTKVSKDFAIAEKTDDVFASFGKDDTASITFTTDVDSTTVDELYLATTDGTKVENGITAVADGAKVNITLGAEVPKGTYKIVIPATFTDIYGQGIGKKGAETAEIAVTTTDVVIEKAATIYEEDFEDWSTTNLLSTATVNSGIAYNADAAKTGETAIPVQIYSTTPTIGSGGSVDLTKNVVAAVDAATAIDENDTHGKVLQYSSTDTSFLEVLLGGGLATDLNNKTTIVEYDMYIKDKVNADWGMPSISKAATVPANYLSTETGWMLVSGTTMRAVGGTTTTEDNTPNETYHWKQGVKYANVGQWYKVKLVITDDGGTTESPFNWRVYVDDVPVTGKYYNHQSATSKAVGDYIAYSYESRNYDYVDSSKTFKNYTIDHKFHGILLGGKSTAAGRTLYFDNFKVSTVNNGFAVTTATRDASKFNAVADVITLTFTQPVDKATVENIVINDKDGNAVADAIKSITYADGDTVMNIALDADKLLGKTAYSVVVPATFTDIYGQGLVTYHNPYRSLSKNDTTWYNADVPMTADVTALDITTAKATEIYIDDVTDGYSSGTFTKTVTVNSVSTEKLPVWIAAAAYDEKNNMVGFGEVEAFELEAGATTTKELTFTVAEGKTAKTVRIFVWDGEDTMKPYQAIEEITIQ